MTARDCDRACGCRAEVERLERRLTAAEAKILRQKTHCAAAQARSKKTREQYEHLCQKTKDQHAEIAKMRPVYEAAMSMWRGDDGFKRWAPVSDPYWDALGSACQAALAADRDREGES